MEYRHLGNSGVKVSAIGLGANQFGRRVDAQGTAAIIHRAMELGVNFIDTADVYAMGLSEKLIGLAIAGRRDQVVLATKVRSPMGEGPNDQGASRYHIMQAVEASLRRLGTDRIDLYQIHSWDPETPLEETMRALDDLVRSGKVRYIGASNFTAWQLCRANDLAEMRAGSRFVSVQNQYSLLHRAPQGEVLPYCRAFGVGFIPWGPLAGGFLTGKYRPGEPPPPDTRFGHDTSGRAQQRLNERNFAILERLERFAAAREQPVAHLAIAWLLAHPEVSSVIAGATRPEQVEDNVKAGQWTLSQDEMAEIERLVRET